MYVVLYVCMHACIYKYIYVCKPLGERTSPTPYWGELIEFTSIHGKWQDRFPQVVTVVCDPDVNSAQRHERDSVCAASAVKGTMSVTVPWKINCRCENT